MSSLPRYAILLGLALCNAGFPTAATSQTQAQKKTPTGSVSGRVTIHGKGAPGIHVGMRASDFSSQPSPALKATTDHDGSYRITNLPAGNYRVSPMSPTYVADSGPVWPNDRGKTLLLGEGEDVQGIDFSVIRGGVITGKVTDADNRPLIEERLMIVRENQADSRGRFPPVMSGAFQTDDRGIYRIYGIPPGRYKISVGVADEGSPANFRFGRVAYKRTFYPNATELDDAKVIEVTEGSEATNIDITVDRSLPGFAASGTVVDGETGKPVQGLRFGLRRIVNNRESGVMGILTVSNSKGEFRIENVTPGKYAIFVAPRQGSEERVDSLHFEVIDQDVTGLLLKTSKGLTITGTVVLDGTYDKSVLAKLAQLRLRAYVRGEDSFSGSWQESPISPDGTFRVGGLGPGRANFSLGQQDRRPPVGFAIVRVEREGAAGPGDLEIKADQPLTGVKIIVRYGTGSIRGEVKLENGPLPTDGHLVVWLKKLGEPESHFRPHNLDSRGHFLIEGLPAGSYELNVNANFAGRRGPTTKQPIDVSEGRVTDVVVSLDLKINQDQVPTP